MTIYGIDVSSWQGNVNWAQVKSEGFEFAIVKCTQGDWYLNPYFVSQLDGAAGAGLITAAYHYIEAQSSAQSQADYFASMCDTNWPVVLDHERGSGSEAQNWAVYCALRGKGYRVILNYFPEWYWQEVGSPPIRFGPMWKSWYPDTVPDYASVIYAKCPESAWSDYGGQTVRLRQFTAYALVAGQQMDANAFEGTREELAALFGGQTEEIDMSGEAEKIDYIYTQLRDLAGNNDKARRYIAPYDQDNKGNVARWLGTLFQSVWNQTFRNGSGIDANAKQLAVVLKAVQNSAQGQPVEVDEQAIAGALLAALTPESIAAAISTDVAAQVVDELNRRLST